VVGEALVDVISAEGALTETVGGSPANVALGLARQGIDTLFLTHLARDRRGLMIQRYLAEEDVWIHPSSLSFPRTSIARATIADDGSANYDFELEWSLPASFDLGHPRLIHCGSIATFLEPGASEVRKILASRERGAIATYDPNIRPSIIGARERERLAFAETAALCDVVKLSDEDARWLYPDLSPHEVLTHILSLGPTLVAITLGAEGSILMTNRASVFVNALNTTVIDTIGAGDTYMASLIFSTLRRSPQDLDDAELWAIGHRASAAAAITVSRSGADLPTLEEIAAEM
jgi:fructokinase